MEMIGILIVFVGLLYGLVLMQQKHISYTKRTFAGLGLGILFGGSLQLIFGTEHEALKGAIEWIKCSRWWLRSVLAIISCSFDFYLIGTSFYKNYREC